MKSIRLLSNPLRTLGTPSSLLSKHNKNVISPSILVRNFHSDPNEADFPSFHLEPLALRHVDQVAVLIALSFSESEPMSGVLKTPPPELFSFSKAYATKAAKQELGVVAVDDNSG